MPRQTIIRVISDPAPQRSWIYDWQTLEAGVLAVILAAITAILLLRQIRAQNRQLLQMKSDAEAAKLANDEATKRQDTAIELTKMQAEAARLAGLRAWRVVLPTVLSEAIDYAELLAQQLATLVPTEWVMYAPESDDDHRKRLMTTQSYQLDLPMFPERLVEPLRKIVEFSDDELLNQRVASVFREIQLLDAVRRDLARGVQHQAVALAGWILQAAALWARVASLFDFARGKSETVSARALWDWTFDGLRLIRIDWEEVHAMAKAEQWRGEAPGMGDELGLPGA